LSKSTLKRRRLGPPLSVSIGPEDDRLELKLCFDFNAIALIEERTGLGVLSGEAWRLLNPDPKLPPVKGSQAKMLVVMLWAASLAYQPEYDGEEGLAALSSYLDAANAPTISATLAEAFIASLPKDRQEQLRSEKSAEDQEALPLDAASVTDGSKSGPSPDTTSDSSRKSSAA
jgi:hypothetical protein